MSGTNAELIANAMKPETDPRVLVERLRKRSMDEGETEGNSLYRDAANALEVSEAERDAALVQVARAWDEGAKTAWQASGEGWNGEYPDEGKDWEKSEGYAEISLRNPHTESRAKSAEACTCELGVKWENCTCQCHKDEK